MGTFLFHDIIFGPVLSRRLGYSLGINILDTQSKICSFNCIYCECGWNPINESTCFVPEQQIIESLEERLIQIKENNELIDVITFAGNGEPTLHPNFDIIIDKCINLRNKYLPKTPIAVLTNSTMFGNDKVRKSLLKIDLPIAKFDSAIEKTFRIINNVPDGFSFENYINGLKMMNNKKVIIQTMFLKGVYNHNFFDNSTDFEINEWLEIIHEINPKSIQIYTLHRVPPANNLEKISSERLKYISNLLENKGYSVLLAK